MMSKRVAIQRARGFLADAGRAELGVLEAEAVVHLAQHLSDAIRASTEDKKTRPSRSSCSQLALQVLLTAFGLRRAALVDALSLTPAQARAVGSKLKAINEHGSSSEAEALGHVCLLFHVPSSQTFVVSTRAELWSDANSPTVWVDCRAGPKHASPNLIEPDAHVTSLITAVHDAVLACGPADALIVPFPTTEEPTDSLHSEAQLVGIALAGFLLEYAAVYCLHNTSSLADVNTLRYNIRPLQVTDLPHADVEFTSSPKNSLASQPLVLFRVTWIRQTSLASSHASNLELLAFSIPQSLATKFDPGNVRSDLATTFESRLHNISSAFASPFANLLASGSVSVETNTVTLHQVAL
ncbi:hypothetical protein PANT_7d00320 [Moesziomyces antarcticus T-34]|uniref:Uncharacterized protein n=1 Tax=Pseudozyma antarctica (strain T-34) TaxID=1151754 RepID=M9MBR6_PSEA3|nr:hypothetical protein PANT_7d00320 [Moesziomyces antarcticus T-34]